MSALDRVLAALDAHGCKPKRSGSGWSVHCPAHEDQNRSLSISEGADGRALLKCHAGCPLDAIVAAVGLELRDLFEGNSGGAGLGEPQALYPYVDETGALLFEVVRFPGKKFLQRRPDGNGGYVWNLEGVTRVLYRLPQVMGAIAEGRAIYVVEGEKDVEAIERAGEVATCNPGGALKLTAELAAQLSEAAEVIVVADRDDGEQGRAHALDVERKLRALAKPPEKISIVQAADGKDAYDHLAAGLSLEEFEPLPEEEAPGLRTRGVLIERVRPTRWLWRRRIPMGLPSLLVGDEGIGKGTLAAWLIARATRGELEGELAGEPVRVLVIGDEDAFEPIWVPRLYAAGADLDMLRTLDDGEFLEDLRASADDLSATVRRDQIGAVIFDQILDNIPGGSEGQAIYNPKSVREALMPLRRISGEHGIAALSLLHPNKGNASSFRQVVAGSHQFNAVSRSSLWLAADPEDESRRVLVRGKGNHSAAPRSFEFAIAAEVVQLNGHTFEVPRVVSEGEGERTIHDLLTAVPASPVRDELAWQLESLLTEEPQRLSDLAGAVGRDPRDGSVRNALVSLEKRGHAEKRGRGLWAKPRRELQLQALTGIAIGSRRTGPEVQPHEKEHKP